MFELVIEYRKEDYKMTNEKALKALQQIKTYCSATQLDELEYVISVLEKLQKDGITDPLNTDFSKLK